MFEANAVWTPQTSTVIDAPNIKMRVSVEEKGHGQKQAVPGQTRPGSTPKISKDDPRRSKA